MLNGAPPVPADFEEVLRRGYDEGRAVHGALPLPFEAFARRALALAERRLGRTGAAAGPPGECRAALGQPDPGTREALAEVLAKAALGDLFLAAACEEGVPGAWETFTARYGPTLVALAIRRGASRAEAEELAREIPGELYAAPPGGGARTRLGTFDGTGSLAAWLGMIVHRRIVDRRRDSARSRVSAEAIAAEGAAPAAAEADPAALADDAETARRFEEAFREAWGALSPRETLAVLLRYRDALPQRSIARILDVGEPRVSRILAGAAEKIRTILARHAGLRPGEEGPGSDRLRAAFRDVVGRSLATPVPPPDPSAHG